jgi:hypothetical protein
VTTRHDHPGRAGEKGADFFRREVREHVAGEEKVERPLGWAVVVVEA